jgi:hypothetical protein
MSPRELSVDAHRGPLETYYVDNRKGVGRVCRIVTVNVNEAGFKV